MDQDRTDQDRTYQDRTYQNRFGGDAVRAPARLAGSPPAFGRPAVKPKKKLPPPRVRKEPPTIDEAAFAAIGLADDLEQQVDIAAGLMGVSPDEARESVMNAKAAAGRPAAGTGTTRPNGHVMVRDRVVTVERASVRRVVLPSRAGPIRLAR